ncbi:hypothetical protein T439DRAFT_329262 [Meredithblackwellia eburnea MCA 4105]
MSADGQPWHAAFPAPKSSPRLTSASEVHGLVKCFLAKQEAGEGFQHPDFLIVDVRRTDFDTAFITSAINLPAHSFYQTIPSLLPVLSAYKRVIFHCQSSNGRGPRCAGWFQDALDERGITADLCQAEVLVGGVKEWVHQFGDDESLVQKL